jgi:outer membrane protein assembly factor BamB
VAVDARSGTERWVRAIGGSGRGTATDGRLVYVAGESDGRIFTFDAHSGDPGWVFDTGFPSASRTAMSGMPRDFLSSK